MVAQSLSKIIPAADGDLTILDKVNLSIAKGEAAAIVGSSGSGKSTLLGLLAGLDQPSSGKVFINNEDLFALDEDGRAAARAANIGFVFQAFQLLPNLTALENVMLPLELVGTDNAKARAQDVLERVGLAQRLTHYPRQLSGGEQQRVAIARAFAPDGVSGGQEVGWGINVNDSGAQLVAKLRGGPMFRPRWVNYLTF